MDLPSAHPLNLYGVGSLIDLCGEQGTSYSLQLQLLLTCGIYKHGNYNCLKQYELQLLLLLPPLSFGGAWCRDSLNFLCVRALPPQICWDQVGGTLNFPNYCRSLTGEKWLSLSCRTKQPLLPFPSLYLSQTLSRLGRHLP